MSEERFEVNIKMSWGLFIGDLGLYNGGNTETSSEIQNQNATIDIVIDRSAHRKEEPRNNSLCPDLSDLLNEIGLPEDTATGNPFMHSPQKPYEVSKNISIE